MILCLYNILFTLFLILYVPYSLLRCLFQKRLRQKLAHRMGSVPKFHAKGPVWIHAASVGEVICSVPLFKKIKKEFPDVPILVTTMTQTGNDTARKLIPEADGVLFFPLTTRSSCEEQSEELSLPFSLLQRQSSGPISSGSAERGKSPFFSSTDGFRRDH